MDTHGNPPQSNPGDRNPAGLPVTMSDLDEDIYNPFVGVTRERRAMFVQEMQGLEYGPWPAYIPTSPSGRLASEVADAFGVLPSTGLPLPLAMIAAVASLVAAADAAPTPRHHEDARPAKRMRHD